MRKSITISLTILSVVAVISILLASSQVVEIPDTNKVPSRKNIVRTIASDLTNYGINFKYSELVVKKYLYQDNWIVAKVLSESTGIAMDAGAVKRIKATSPQKELGDKGRKRNIRGAFAVQKNVKGENIVLIDDIYTTGSTLDEAARVLKKAGAENVYFLTVSIGQGI